MTLIIGLILDVQPNGIELLNMLLHKRFSQLGIMKSRITMINVMWDMLQIKQSLQI